MRKKFWKSPCCGDTTVSVSGPRKQKKNGKITCYRMCTCCGKRHRVEIDKYGQIIGLYEKPHEIIHTEGNTTFIDISQISNDKISLEDLQKKLDYMLNF